MIKLLSVLDATPASPIPDDARRIIIYILIFLVLIFVLIGAIGALIKKIMHDQGALADGLIHDVVVTGVITNERKLRLFGYKKNRRQFFKESWLPFVIMLVAFAILFIFYMTMNQWWVNPFDRYQFGTLLFHFDWDNAMGEFFGIHMLVRWPDVLEDGWPNLRADAWGSYFFVPIFLTGAIWYLVCVQAFIARDFRIYKLSKQVFNKSLEGYDGSMNPASPINPEDPSKVKDTAEEKKE